jgi:hypothetical protein
MTTTAKPSRRSAGRQAFAQATAYRDNPTAFVGQQGQVAATLEALPVSDLRDLMPDGVSKSKDGKAAPKALLIERFCQWVELGGQTEAKPAKPVKAKPEKKPKPDPAAVFTETLAFLGDLEPHATDFTTIDRTATLKRLAELADQLPAGTSKDALDKPTLRNVVEALNDGMSEDDTALPVSGPKAKLVERIAAYFGLIDPPEVKRTVARVTLAEFTDDEIAAELERRRQKSSQTHQLVTGGVC